MTVWSTLLRRHVFGSSSGLVDVVATGVVGDFGRLAGGVFERRRLHRPFGRRLGFDRVGLRLGKRVGAAGHGLSPRSEEHTSELQSLMRISYAVFCLKKKTNIYYENM